MITASFAFIPFQRSFHPAHLPDWQEKTKNNGGKVSVSLFCSPTRVHSRWKSLSYIHHTACFYAKRRKAVHANQAAIIIIQAPIMMTAPEKRLVIPEHSRHYKHGIGFQLWHSTTPITSPSPSLAASRIARYTSVEHRVHSELYTYENHKCNEWTTRNFLLFYTIVNAYSTCQERSVRIFFS